MKNAEYSAISCLAADSSLPLQVIQSKIVGRAPSPLATV